MSNVLTKIVADKRIEIEQRKIDFPVEHFKDKITPSTKSLFDELAKPKAGYILECKKASPSKGLIRPEFNLDQILSAYTPYAAGISVLTDEKYFQGTFEYLQYVTERVSQPVLNKDFFIDEYQVYLARHYNADAILLMLSVLDDEQYCHLASIADALSLDILTEVSNEQEMARAIDLRAKIIGINNRNLRDLSTDLATTERLVPMLEKATHEHVVISESGIYTYQDVQRLAPLCHGFLVGSSLMAQDNLPLAVSSLVLGETKICGITSADTAQQIFEFGARYGGLIFAEKSPRCVTSQQASQIVNQVAGQYVGVFVNKSAEDVATIAQELSLCAVQLHGSEDQVYRQTLREKLPSCCQLWQAIGVTDSLPEALDSVLAESAVDKVLLDCKVGNQSGGTGQSFDWRLLSSIENKCKLVLAGGIGPDNVRQAVAIGVGVIDVNSGVEDAPGQKSEQKLAALFEQLRSY